MGSEDDRIWRFYAKDMEDDPLGNMGKHVVEEVKINSGINYLGDGEILDVKKTPQDGKIKLVMNNDEGLIAEEEYIKIPTSYQIMKYGDAGDKELLLTFDDGPDSRWTPQILDILKQYHINAAFFVVCLQAARNVPLVKRIYDEGNLVGNHTFTHRNVANVSPERTFAELKLTRLLIECITGHTTILFRPPYNADSEPANMEELVPVVLAREQNYIDVGESIDPEDWQPGITADQICTDCFCSTVHCICDRCKIFRCLAGCTTDQCNRSNGNTFVDNWDTVFSFDLPCNFCKIFGN